jgi:hypothetical protein
MVHRAAAVSLSSVMLVAAKASPFHPQLALQKCMTFCAALRPVATSLQ